MFNYENLAKNLPDCYKKGYGSNNYKILEIERAANQVSRDILQEIYTILNIDEASGSTLDMYGERFGQPRGKATDAQFRKMIRSKIARSLSNGSYKDIVDAICHTFGCDISEVKISETGAMTVTLEVAPIASILAAGFSTGQAEQIISSLLPVSVSLESVLFGGTFEFSATETEYDESAGFSDSEDGSIGGYLGWTAGEASIDSLPI